MGLALYINLYPKIVIPTINSDHLPPISKISIYLYDKILKLETE